jgi:hypothetical protein
LANFVGIVVGFFNVCKIRLRRLLLAAALSFESGIGMKLFLPGDLLNYTEKRIRL